jgi:outer membrane protein TolC
MRRHVIISILILVSGHIYSQKVLTLWECYDLAAKQSSLAGEKDYYKSVWQLKDKNLSKNWLPTLDANASYVYNSDVIDLSGVFESAPIPGLADAIKPLPHEQYKITLDINQVIYDGGLVQKSKAAAQADLKVNQQQTETDLYKIRNQINTIYFSILLLDHQKELLNIYLGYINKRLESLRSALNNGIITKSDIYIITSEKIKIEQQLGEIAIKRSSMIRVLSDLTGTPPGDEISVILPVASVELETEITRPELRLFDLRKDQLETGLKVLQTRRMPKAFGFATLGYGNPPGNNFFKDQFAPYYILGAGIKWNIFDWNRVKNEKQEIKIQQQIITGRQEDLTESLKRSLELKNAEIENLESLLKSDTTLITLRKKVTSTAESQYENGTITATEYMNVMNSEKEAVINFEIHKINLAMARVDFMNISGTENKQQ